mgnify:CR=1 FL=1
MALSSIVPTPAASAMVAACVTNGAISAASGRLILADIDNSLAGEIVTVVGPNGAGKTTLINTIAGLVRVRSGELRVDGRVVNTLAPHRFCDLGIALVPEGRRLFTGMSVLEKGGNAFDAGVASLIAGGVLEQDLYSLGGEALVLVYPKKENKVTSIVGQGCST